MAAALYDDGSVVCDDAGLLIRNYYFPFGDKRIPYSAIRSVSTLALSGANQARRFRIWGSGDLRHWWNLDTSRPNKDAALVIDVGKHLRPAITPDDPVAVERIITARIGPTAGAAARSPGPTGSGGEGPPPPTAGPSDKP